jgi:hypothetical protein
VAQQAKANAALAEAEASRPGEGYFYAAPRFVFHFFPHSFLCLSRAFGRSGGGVQAKLLAKNLALASRVPVFYFAPSALLAECLVSCLSVRALRAEGPVSHLSMAALGAQRNRSYIQKSGRFAHMF